MGVRTQRLCAGDHVVMVVRCKNMHLFSIHGIMKADGGVACGEVTAPGAPDDPTICKECGEPFEGSYGGWRHDVKAQREHAQKVVAALPFKWHPVGCSNPSNNHQGGSYGSHHIVLDEPLTIGRVHREAHDALCKPARQFNGNLWVDSDGPTCKRCLELASRLTQQHQQSA